MVLFLFLFVLAVVVVFCFFVDFLFLFCVVVFSYLVCLFYFILLFHYILLYFQFVCFLVSLYVCYEFPCFFSCFACFFKLLLAGGKDLYLVPFVFFFFFDFSFLGGKVVLILLWIGWGIHLLLAKVWHTFLFWRLIVVLWEGGWIKNHLLLHISWMYFFTNYL